MRIIWSLQDAKNKFSEVVDAACAGTPQVVTRRGTPTAVVLSTEAYGHLLRHAGDAPASFKDLLLAMPQAKEEDDLFRREELPLREVGF